MLISGMQKLTLLDFPGKTAATVFTLGCNLLCPFCHNALLVTDTCDADIISEDEVLSYLEKRAGILDGVCITGGEPCLQTDLIDFISKIKTMRLSVKLDTNGTCPDVLRSLINNGLLDYVAMDIKNSREKYAETTGIPDFDISPVEESVSLLLEGRVDYEFRTTVVRELHAPEDISKIGEWISGAPRYFLQNFVDSGNIIGKNLSAHDAKTLDSMRVCAEEFVDFVSLRGI